MKANAPLLKNFSSQEMQRLILPSMIGALLLMGIILIGGIYALEQNLAKGIGLIGLSIISAGYISFLYGYILPKPSLLERLKWYIVFINSLGMILLSFLLIPPIQSIYFFLALITVLTLAIIGGRPMAYLYTAITTIASGNILMPSSPPLLPIVIVLGFLTAIVISAEATLRLVTGMHRRIERLETVNTFARNISASLEMQHLKNLLNAAIQNTMNADTFFVGILDAEGMLNIDLLYDDGEYFPHIRLSPEGSLSGWVLRNKRSLFLADLREEPSLEGVQKLIIGNDKTNLSWMGAPMITANVNGVVAIASYKHNAFDRMDMELLENIAQQAAFAFDNAYHHTEVENQSRLDSLTSVYNHGYFLRCLEGLANDAISNQSALSLIMLDVDYFKRYNDTYGHLFGDLVLQTLVETIRKHVKATDVVGRWGGEEFAVALPDTSGPLALKVARRIQKTMAEMRLQHPEKGDVPAPTVSQGIAILPLETADIFKLVDIADRRLYLAKERGRNQIEPDEGYWEKTTPIKANGE